MMNGESSYMYFADTNGDGRADLVKHNLYGAFNTFLSIGSRFSETPQPTATTVLANEYNDVHFIDLNGDGLADLVKRNQNGEYQTSLSLSDGTFGFEQIIDLGLMTFESRYIHFTDLNGDGLADLVKHSRDGYYQSFMSLGDGTFSTEPVTFTPASLTGESPMVHFIDVNGDGLDDLIKYSQILGAVNTYLAVGTPADLLYGVAYAVDQSPEPFLAAMLTHTYKSSSAYSNVLLPFVVQTLSQADLSVTTLGEGGSWEEKVSTTTYDYSGGYYDARQRDFQGFRETVQTNPDATIVNNRFLIQDEFLKGRQERFQFKAPGGSPLLIQADFTWDKVFVDPADTSAFVKLLQRRTEFYDGETAYIQSDLSYDDTNGNLLSAVSSGTSAESVTTAYLYDNYGAWLWRRTQETVTGSISGKVRETYFEYENGTGNLLASEHWLDGGDNPRVTMTYDSFGNLITSTDARGNTTTTVYETAPFAFPSRVISPSTGGVDHIVEYPGYDYRWGRVTTAKDENGQFTYYSYDDQGRLVGVQYPDGGDKTVEYYDNELPRRVVVKTRQDTGNTIDTYSYYDGLLRKNYDVTRGGNLGSWVRSDWFFDEMGRNYFSKGPYYEGQGGSTSWQRTTFDYRGRPTLIQSPDPEYGTVAIQYAYNGFSTRITDPDGAGKTDRQDYLGRIYQVVEHADQNDILTDYEYNAAGDLLSVTNEYGHTTLIDYDTLGRKLAMNDPDMGHWSYSYDPNGNLLAQTDGKLQEITFGYDELNRLTSKNYATAEPAVTYVYDQSINGIGRLSSVSNGQASTDYNEYDLMGRLVSETRTIVGAPATYTMGYRYNLAGQLTKLIYPDGYEINYWYMFGTEYLYGVYDYFNVYHARMTNYTPDAKPGMIEYGGYAGTYSAVDEYTYNPLSTRLERIVSRPLSGSGVFQDLQYRYSPAGDIIEIKDNVRLVTYAYSYDKLHRLVEELATGYAPIIQNTTLDYTYDDAFQPHAVKTIALDGTGYDYTYDDNGNMDAGPDFTDPASVASRTITYNADNMPVSITHSSGGTTQFVYDGEIKRIAKIAPGSTTYYVNDFFEINNGNVVKYIFAGDIRIAKRVDNATYYYHKDHLGSARSITNSVGEEQEYTEYMPFGHQRSHAGTSITNYKYTDQELDPSTGLYNYDARLYDPVIGRFVSADSFIEDFFIPQTLNRYSYVRNNALRYTDPTGHETTGEFLERKGVEAAASGSNVAAYGWAFVDTAWSFFGMESVSKVTDNVITDRGDLTGWDVAGAVVDVATLGKGGGAVAAGKKLGAKAISKASKSTVKEGIYEFVDTTGKK